MALAPGLLRRALARMLDDGLLLGLPATPAIVAALVSGPWALVFIFGKAYVYWPATLLAVVAYLLGWEAFWTHAHGGTPFKRLLRMRVASAEPEGGAVDWMAALTRASVHLLKLVVLAAAYFEVWQGVFAVVAVSFVLSMPLDLGQRRSIMDRLAGTRVVSLSA